MRHFLMIILLLLPGTAYSQSGDGQPSDNSYFHMPVNISLHVTKYRDYSLGRILGGGRPVVNYMGINVFSGKAARLRGFQAAGVGAVFTEDMIGGMASGVTNIVLGNGFGLQVAGVANVVEGNFGFLQVGGVANVVNGRFYGGQAAIVANIIGNDFAGVQFGGIANIVEGSFTGLRGGGIANVTNGDVKGIQFGGIANVANGNMHAITAAGIANVMNGYSKGISLAGIANVGNAYTAGFQAAGIANVGNSHADAVRFAGVANVTNANFRGVQVAGIANVINSNGIGINIAGVGNVTNGNYRGAQVTGISSVVNGSMFGIQASGLVNVAHGEMTGVQIGSINVSDDDSVLPLGLYSVAGNAPSYYEYWVNESGFVNAGIRSGSKWFHNMVFAGIQMNNPIRWSLGWGAGTHHRIDDNLYLDVEGSVQHINEDEFWTSEKNLLTKARVLIDWELTETVTIYAGPSYNYLYSKVNDGSDIAPWSHSESNSNGTWKRSWIGFDLGLRLVRPDSEMGMFGLFDFLDI